MVQIPNIRTQGASCPLAKTLETLIISTAWVSDYDYGGQTKLDASGFYETLLASCSSTICRLEFSHCGFDGIRSNNELNNVPLSFNTELPMLETLHIGDRTLLDAEADSVLPRLVREGLTTLFIPYNRETFQSLSKIGQILTLKNFFIGGSATNGEMPTGFIKANTQIESLVAHWKDDRFMVRLLQSLEDHGDLKKLSLVWSERHIPETSLSRLSLLSSLETLHIGAITEYWRFYNWVVDHDKIMTYVRRLPGLKRLIITGDVYSFGPEHGTLWYYDIRQPGSESWPTHETEMFQYAVAYFLALPMLEFLHIGQILFAVEDGTNNGLRRPVMIGSAWIGAGGYNILKKEFKSKKEAEFAEF
ncbi:hypothetical protein F4808DRAFT_470627 [Astrocystis sublimbata]|nr:hypothetical protein F4808DRAFT_470627 [Astrocystis sublimbata]